jgi:hypothetical protein
MKKILTTLILITCIVVTGVSQAFEGSVTYQNSYKSKNPALPDQQLTSMMGTTQEYFVKGGNYKSTINGTMVEWQLYNNKENKLYSKMRTSLAVFWTDAAVNKNEVTKAEINKSVIDILGYSCDELVLTSKDGFQKFYFNSKLALDPSLYTNHKFGNWYEFLSKAKAVPLKMIIDTPQFSMESVATEIKPMKLEDKMFELPADAKLQKSPF